VENTPIKDGSIYRSRFCRPLLHYFAQQHHRTAYFIRSAGLEAALLHSSKEQHRREHAKSLTIAATATRRQRAYATDYGAVQTDRAQWLITGSELTTQLENWLARQRGRRMLVFAPECSRVEGDIST
jgi:hypothetical protein